MSARDMLTEACNYLQIDERMMTELREVGEAVKPTDTLLVVDAMTGQEAASLVKAFNDAYELTGWSPLKWRATAAFTSLTCFESKP